MEGALKLARQVGSNSPFLASIKTFLQYYYQIGQPQRKYFIARRLSYHGNTLATLSVAFHAARRTPYEDILNQTNFHHVSPAYYKRFKLDNESQDEYVTRLAAELEAKFQELGPENVIGCTSDRDCI